MKTMMNNIKIISFVFLAAVVGMSGCKKTEYSFGELKAPSNLEVTTTIIGVDADNPDGNGTGKVFISSSANDLISYNIDFGDGNSMIVHTDTMTYAYTTPGTNEFTISVKAIGTGGMTSTYSTKVKVFVAFVIPTYIVEALTDNTSKVWVTDKEATGHFGVSPTDAFSPIWYAATPNSRAPEAYDDEITFTKDVLNNIYMNVDNKGLTFMIGAATTFYGFSGGDGNYALNTGGNKKLMFMNATSASTSENSTRIQFKVPGNGIINFGTGGVTYEILEITATTIHLRNIGADGNAWYQKLKVKS